MAILEGRSVSRDFGGVRAVDNVDFAVEEGEILGLIGPNGAGKTTLLNLISRLMPLSSGEILLGSRRISHLSPHRIAQLGLSRTFQIVKPFVGLTVAENVAVGAAFASPVAVGPLQYQRKVSEVLALVGLEDRAHADVQTLTLSGRKRLELARALAMQPKVLLLDEIMAGLTPREVGGMMDLIRSVNATGVTVLMIEHVMQAIMGISHRVMVLHHGRKIAVGTPREVVEDQRVVEAYLGARYARSAAVAKGGGS